MIRPLGGAKRSAALLIGNRRHVNGLFSFIGKGKSPLLKGDAMRPVTWIIHMSFILGASALIILVV